MIPPQKGRQFKSDPLPNRDCSVLRKTNGLFAFRTLFYIAKCYVAMFVGISMTFRQIDDTDVTAT